MFSKLQSLIHDDAAATMVEYGLLLALIALVVFTAVQGLGISINSFYNTAAGSI